MKSLKKNNRGITLIILVITIVIMGILAAISIKPLLGDMNLINKAKDTKIRAEVVTVSGAVQKDIIAKEIETDSTITNEQVVEILQKYGTVQYEEDNVTIKGIVTQEGTEISLQELYDEEIVY